VARYNENVLGVRTVDWGTIGLVALIVAVVVVGAVVLGTRMGWVTVSFEKAEKAPVTASTKEEPKA
jgi:hypothetical protein